MEVVRERCLADPSFAACPSLIVGSAPGEEYQYQPPQPQPQHDAEEDQGGPHDAAPPPGETCPPGLEALLHPTPANLAALRCSWTQPAVIALVMAQGLPGVSLPGAAADGGALPCSPPLQQPRSLWNSMLPALSAAHRPVCSSQLLSLSAAAAGAGAGIGQAQAQARTLVQPNVCVGHQDDWLELSPAMLPLWPTVPFEPYAGQKPVQYFVLCPEDLQGQALQFVKDVGAHYELCNLGTHHPVPQRTWLYTFSTARPPGSAPAASATAGGQQSYVQRLWAQLSPQQRYMVGLRAAAERLQRALLTSALQLRQGGSALEVNLGSAPVVYVVCPFGEDSCQQEAALVEVACCLAPCTPLGADAEYSSSGSGSLAAALAAIGPAMQSGTPGEPATPDPGAGRHAASVPANGVVAQPGAGPMDMDPPAAQAPASLAGIAEQGTAAAEAADEPNAGAEAGRTPKERYHGAAECLFQPALGNCQRAAHDEVPPRQAPPVDLTLQVLGPACLSDLSGQAAAATAFELYLKIRRRPQDPCALPQEGSSVAAASPVAPLVPFCSEPLFVLAAGGPQPGGTPPTQRQRQQQDGRVLSPGMSQDMPDLLSSPSATGEAPAAPTQSPRTLHCCYALPADLAECTVVRPHASGEGQHSVLLMPAAWTDSCGELLHCEVLEVDLQGPSSLERRASLGGPLQRSDSLNLDGSPQGLACTALLQRSVELLGHLRAAAQPPNALQHVAVTRLGAMHVLERAAWCQILSDRPLLLPELSSSHRMAVVGVVAAPPARLASPGGDTSTGSARLLLQSRSDQQQAAATLALLPGDNPAALVLPGEHDTVRALALDFVAGTGAGAAPPDDLALATELYGLSLLTAAHFGLLWGSCTAPGGLRAGMGPGPPPTAHLPLHAYLAGRMLALTRLLCRAAGRR